jgi:hypothetical protein
MPTEQDGRFVMADIVAEHVPRAVHLRTQGGGLRAVDGVRTRARGTAPRRDLSGRTLGANGKRNHDADEQQQPDRLNHVNLLHGTASLGPASSSPPQDLGIPQ